MTLTEMTHAIFEIMRGGLVVDDERFDSRLMEDLIKAMRLEYLEDQISKRYYISDNNTQKITLDLTLRESDGILESGVMPKILAGRNKLEIHEIASPSHYTSYVFTLVPLQRFRFSGNGKYNQNIVYATTHFDKLMLKSANDGFKLLNSCTIDAVFEDPTEVPNYSDDDDFPVDFQGFEYIKDQIIKRDVSTFITMNSDEVNDADGEIDDARNPSRNYPSSRRQQ